MEEEKWHSKHIKEVLERLNTSEKGLSSSEAAKRLKENGLNAISHEKKAPALKALISQFKNFTIYILLFADIISLTTNELPEFIVISIIIFVVILMGFFEEYKASKEIEALKNLTPRKAKAYRDGKLIEILAQDIAPGDIILLERGNIIPADARIISCNNLHVDESTLTGESVSVVKKEGIQRDAAILAEQYNMAFASTQITNGNAIAVVVRTGKQTEIGKVSSMMSKIKEEETPLQKRLDRLGEQLSIGVFIICVLIIVIGLLRGESLPGLLLLAVAVAVAGIPESLPTTIAITLALGVKRMASRNAIVKRLPAVETLGTCTVICSDKTGTLTQNKMVIEKIFTLDTEVDVTGSGFEPKGFFMVEGKTIDPKKHHTLTKVLEVGVFCNNSDIKKTGEGWDVDGEPTEGAFVVLAKKAGMEKKELHIKFPRLKEHPFDPVRKCMSTVHLVKKRHMVYSKGAPEILLKKADYYLENGIIKKMTQKIRRIILESNERFAKAGKRVLALAFKEHEPGKLEIQHVESELVFVGLAIMRDPPEEHAKESVQLCKDAGVRVVMITGDNRVTAEAVARELGIYEKGDLIIEGNELEKLNEEGFLGIIEKVRVYARTTPKHKLRIVEALQKKGFVVAMTGDGVNDAPALKKADIGVAMGKRGTDVAKEASEMIIKDDNFSTIVSAIKEGRTIYANMQKFIYYSLTTCMSEVIIILIAIILSSQPILTALMILFLNLVTGDFPALALSVEQSSKNIMKQRPRSSKESILSDYLLLKTTQNVPFVVLGTIGIYMWELLINHAHETRAQTAAFVALIFFELFHVFNAKSWEESVFSIKSLTNVYLNAGIIFSLLLTFLVVYFPPAQWVFGTVSLAANEVIVIFLTTSIIVFFNEIQKTMVNAEIKEREKMAVVKLG
jgi:Ca2+-transporting ATPase